MRWAELVVLGFTVVLALVEAGRIAVLYGGREMVIAAAATAVWLPLHLWHLQYGLRDERPPRSGVTLAIIAAVQFAALALIGPAWSFMLATLATSALIVLRPPWSWAVLLACVTAPIPAVILDPQYTTVWGVNVEYLMVAVAFRACLQFTLVWLVASTRELVASRALVAREAAETEHARLEATMRGLLERSFVELADQARRARAAVLEPGVSAALVALDRVVATASEAAAELRQVLTRVRTTPGPDPAVELARAEARARSPIGRGLNLPGAWRSFVAVHVVVLGFVLGAGLGAFGGPYAGAKVIPAWTVLTVVHLGSLLAVARGSRPRRPYARLLFIAGVSVTMMVVLGIGWRDPGWYIGVAVAVAFRGRVRMAAVAAVILLAAGYDIGRELQVSSPRFVELIWDFSYESAITALGVIGLYGSARLIQLLGELDLAREAHVRYAVEAERRRIWGDVHDVLGQTLTAISLKADLARRTIFSGTDTPMTELDEVIELAADQARELGVIARGEREVSFGAEVEGAIALLRAAGIEVSSELEVGELDQAASGLLGWAIREGTTNVLRHARARHVSIRAGRESGQLVLELRNDGASGPVGGGTGLRGLAERANGEGGRAAGSLLPEGEFVLWLAVPERVLV